MRYIKFIFVLLFMCAFQLNAQETRFSGETQLELGYLHLGSYSKERPVFGIHQRISYNFIQSKSDFLKNRLSVGLALGIQALPNALALPLSIAPKLILTKPKEKGFDLYTRQEFGINLPVSDVFLHSSLYSPSLGFTWHTSRTIDFFTEIGGFYLWDQYGGKEVTLTLDFGITYPLGKK